MDNKHRSFNWALLLAMLFCIGFWTAVAVGAWRLADALAGVF